MAPVAGGIPDAEKDGFILFFGLTQCLISPRIPINRIVSMLQKIRTRLMKQPIRMFMIHFQAPKLYIAIEIPNDKEKPGSSVTQKTLSESSWRK
jgi:hypothetical protein